MTWVGNIVILWMNQTFTTSNYCGKIMKAGTRRPKEHLMEKRGNVAPCPKALKNVREELWKLFREKATTSINVGENVGSFGDTNK